MWKKIPSDKKKHFLCGFLLTLLGVFGTPFAFTGVIAGVLKEVYDKYTNRGTPDLYDILWTWLGCIPGFIVLLFIL